MKRLKLLFCGLLLFMVGCADHKYEVKFVDFDESIIETYQLSEDESIPTPIAPTREGYKFTGWDQEFDRAREDLVIKAEYELLVFEVKFVDGTTELAKVTVEYGKDATAPADPEKEGHTFTGWDKEFKNVKADLVVNAEFDKHEYDVKFFVDGEQVGETQVVKYGEAATAPADPEKVGHEFTGWDVDFDNITEDLVVNAEFEADVFEVVFKADGVQIGETQIVEYGKAAIAPADPTKDGLSFTGWDVEFDNITEDLVVNAIFELLEYEVKFMVDGEQVGETQIVSHGESAKAPKEPLKAGYTFVGWDQEFGEVTSDLIIKAIFEEEEFELKFYDGDKELFFATSTYKYSDDFALPIPEKAGYEFAGWYLSKISLYEIRNITSDLFGNLKLYSRWVKTESDILEIPENGVEIPSINKNLHSTGTFYVYQPAFPVGANTSVLAYNWVSSNTGVATISAYSSISVASSGYAVITGTLISDPNYVIYCVINTSVDGVVKATLEEANAPNYLYARFHFDDGSSLEKITTKGGYVVPPTASYREGYTFTGWFGPNDEDIYNIVENTDFYASYQVASKTYAGKTISILGDSITTYAGYIPTGFTNFYPYATADVADVNQTWWMQFINHHGMKLLANNSWSGSAVAGTAASAAQNKSRLEHLFIGDVLPDVILIFMGANDAPSPYITASEFNLAYGKMLNLLKELAPDSEIIVCTLPSITMISTEAQVEYNTIIRNHATTNNLTIFDFEKAFLREDATNFLVDSAHPNYAGMKKLADVAISDFFKNNLE